MRCSCRTLSGSEAFQAYPILARSKTFRFWNSTGIGEQEFKVKHWLAVFEDLWPGGLSDPNFVSEGPPLYRWARDRRYRNAVIAYDEYLGTDPEPWDFGYAEVDPVDPRIEYRFDTDVSEWFPVVIYRGKIVGRFDDESDAEDLIDLIKKLGSQALR